MKANLERIAKIRSFNRFYTNLLGLLDRTLLKSKYSLTEVRIMFEINRLTITTASELVKILHLDPAYLSRILNRFEEKRLIQKKQSNKDLRKQILSITSDGKQLISELQDRANNQIKTLLTEISDEEQDQLINSMSAIEKIFKSETKKPEFYSLRSHRPGDIGYITHRHGVIYANEYQLDVTFEAYVAKYMAEFIESYDPTKEKLWVVEQGNKNIGSIAIAKIDDKTAQLRWLFVEPHMRNNGIGTKLIHEALNFSRNQGYQKVMLGTFSDLIIARRLYEKHGFRLVKSKSHHIWGQNLTEEQWELIF